MGVKILVSYDVVILDLCISIFVYLLQQFSSRWHSSALKKRHLFLIHTGTLVLSH